MKAVVLVGLLSALLLVAGPASARKLSQETTVASVAESAGLTTLLQAANATGLADTISDPSFVGTVFAPTNGAFADALVALDTTEEELAASGALAFILEYHVLPAAYQASQLVTGQPFGTLAPGQSLTFSEDGDIVEITAYKSTANITQADVPAGQAVVHVINAVLVPNLADLAPAPAPSGAESS